MFLFALALLAAPAAAPLRSRHRPARPSWPTHEADYSIPDFHFRSGETLPVLRIHHIMLGQPHRDAHGAIDNAVMVLHGTGKQFLSPQFADELYGPGQPLDIRRYWIILPDNIGHGNHRNRRTGCAWPSRARL